MRPRPSPASRRRRKPRPRPKRRPPSPPPRSPRLSRPLILASASPRRRELLARLGVNFQVEVSRFDEATLAHLSDPEEYVRRAAEEKAREVAGRLSGFVLGVDTDVVSPDGVVLGKPETPDHAREMLRNLSGRTHIVLSALCLLDTHGAPNGITRRETALVSTRVTFAPLSNDAIEAYVATSEPYDKAGGYGFQGKAMAFIAKLDGDPSSVIGLPLATTVRLLEGWNIPLWGAVDPAV